MLPLPFSRRAPGAWFFLALSSLPCAARGADYFVAPDGNDGASGRQESKPFRTVRKAVEAANQPGDTVWLRGGVYPADNWNNQLSLRYSGTAQAPITYRNYPGELPILDGAELYAQGASGVEPVFPATEPVAHVRVIGIVARNWGTSGFSNGWPDSEPNLASSNLSFTHCIADSNGVNGFSFAGASNVNIQGSIAAHNGARLPSWSSGFTLFGASGNNVLDGNVAFENIDVSARPEYNGRPTDGNGFILDEGTTHGYLVNNIAFRNGGSCMKVTLSSGATLMNNVCFQNGQDANAQFNNELYLSEEQSGLGTSLRNNVVIAGPRGNRGGNGIPFLSAERDQNNLSLTTASSPFASIAGSLDFRVVANATQLIDQASTENAPGTDIGFDPRCIRQQSGQRFWWQYVIDYDYVESVGGVAGCFAGRVSRPAGTGSDIGAYEKNGTLVGCSAGSECSDGAACTRDLCDADRSCVNLPSEGCCTTASECDDGDACTQDSCDAAASRCVNQVDSNCGQNLSGDFSVDNYGYAAVCNWSGYSWTYAGPAAPGVLGTVSSITKSSSLCYSGMVAAQEGYSGIAMVGLNINQARASGAPAENVSLGGAGINLSVVNQKSSALRLQIQSAPDAAGTIESWCVQVEGSGGFYPWSQFNTRCWSPAEGAPYNAEPVNVIAITVAGDNAQDREFAFCLNKISPSGDTCVSPPLLSPSGGNSPGAGLGSAGTGAIGVVNGVSGNESGMIGGAGVAPGESTTAVNTGSSGPLPPGAAASERSGSRGCALATRSRGQGDHARVLPVGLLIALAARSRRRPRPCRARRCGAR